MVNCKLDLNAILTDNGAGGSPALLFVKFFYHQPFVTSVTKTSKAGLPLFLSAKGYLGISKSETDPRIGPMVDCALELISFLTDKTTLLQKMLYL